MNSMLRVFIGYDSREPAAFAVAAHSVLRHASRPVQIIPLIQHQLRRVGVYWRERGPTESTEFSLTRFLVPHLSDFEGASLFLDSDVLVQADVYDLLLHVLAEPNKSVHVVQHDYTPKEGTKFLGHAQTVYPCKNWSSVVLFNNAMCGTLTPEYVNSASGLDLHRFNWLKTQLVCPLCGRSDGAYRKEPNRDRCKCSHCGKVFDTSPGVGDADPIGALPLGWNWLVGEYEDNPDAKILHYTLGGPWFPETANCSHADLWVKELKLLLP